MLGTEHFGPFKVSYRYTGAFLKLYKIAQSQSALDKWINFAFTARLNSFTTKQAPRPQSSRAARSGGTAQSRTFGDLLDEQGRSEATIECLRKALRAAPDHTDAMFNLALPRQG